MEKEKLEKLELLSDYYKLIFEKDLIEELAEVGFLRKIPKGELLIDIGDELTHTPLIIEGAIKVSLENNEKEEISLYYLERGETCAISFVNCIHRSHSIFRGVAEKDTIGLFIPVGKLDEWLVKYPSWRHYIIDSYHYRLIELVSSVKGLAFKSLEQRLIHFLLEKARLAESPVLIIQHQDIARDIHTSRPVVSRMLKELELRGVVRLRRGKIIVPNLELLMEIDV